MIKLPYLYLTANAPQPVTDRTLGFDQFARSAMETWRESYNPLPTASLQEFRAFFSEKNYKYLYAEAKRQARGYEPDAGELFEAMLWSFSMVKPRCDEMDERRDLLGADVTKSYLRELNYRALEKVVPEIVASNELWECYARNMNGPVDFQKEDDGYIDTRTRFTGSRADMTYMLP